MDRNICCPTTPNIPNDIWDFIKKIPALRYMLAPVTTVEDLYRQYSYRDIERNSFAYVTKENTFYVWRECEEHFEHYSWQPLYIDLSKINIEDFGDIISNSLKTNEDLFFNKDKELSLSNKEFNENEHSGLGRVYLRKNIVDSKNILTQEMINKPNTIYIIQYDFDLNGAEITIPEGCVLDFKGGSVSNGSIIGYNTKLDAEEYCIFKNVNLGGDWNVPNIYVSWMKLNAENEDSRTQVQSVLNLQSDEVYNTIYFPTHKISFLPIRDSNALINLTSNTHLIIPSTVKILPNNLTHYYGIKINKKQNIVVDGGGSIIGDVGEHTYSEGSTSEWGMGIDCTAGKNITIKDISCTYCIGDGIYIGGEKETELGLFEKSSENIIVDNVHLLYNRRQGLSLICGRNITIKNSELSYTGTVEFTSPGCGIDVEPNYDTQGIENLIIDNCKFSNNKYASILFYSRAYNKHIRISNCIIDKVNKGEKKPKEKITFVGDFEDINISNCFIEGTIAAISRSHTDSYINEFNFIDCTITGGVTAYEASQDKTKVGDYKFYNCIFNIPEEETQTIGNSFFFLRNKLVDLHFYECTINRIAGSKSVFYVEDPFISINAYNCRFNTGEIYKYFKNTINCYIEVSSVSNFELPIHESVNFIGNTIISKNEIECFLRPVFLSNTSSIDKLTFNISGNTFIGNTTGLPISNFSNSKTNNASVIFRDNIFTNETSDWLYHEILEKLTIVANIEYTSKSLKQSYPMYTASDPKMTDVQNWGINPTNGTQIFHTGDKRLKISVDEQWESIAYLNDLNGLDNNYQSIDMSQKYGWYKLLTLHTFGAAAIIELYNSDHYVRYFIRSSDEGVFIQPEYISNTSTIKASKLFNIFKVIDGVLYAHRDSAISVWAHCSRYVSVRNDIQTNLEYIGEELPQGSENYNIYFVNKTGTFENRPKNNSVCNMYAYFCTDRKLTEEDSRGTMIYKYDDVWVDALGRVID